MHVLRVGTLTKSTSMVTACAGHTCCAWTPTKNDGAGRAVQLWNGHHDGAFHRQQTTVRAAPLVKRLKFNGMRGHVGHIQFGQYLFCGFGIVVGRATDQRKTTERDHGIHANLAVLDEKSINGWAGVQAGCKSRNHAQTLGLQGRNHAIVMTRIARQQIRTQQQNTDGAFHRNALWQRQGLGVFTVPSAHSGVVHTYFGIVNWRLNLDLAAQ